MSFVWVMFRQHLSVLGSPSQRETLQKLWHGMGWGHHPEGEEDKESPRGIGGIWESRGALCLGNA